MCQCFNSEILNDIITFVAEKTLGVIHMEDIYIMFEVIIWTAYQNSWKIMYPHNNNSRVQTTTVTILNTTSWQNIYFKFALKR